MRYYQCKCGKNQSWGSMPPNRCNWCEICKSDMASHAHLHNDDKIEHEFVETEVETDNGKAVLSRCKYCFKTKKQIEEKNG